MFSSPDANLVIKSHFCSGSAIFCFPVKIRYGTIYKKMNIMENRYPLNDGEIPMDYFLARIDEFYGKDSEDAKAIRNELLSKESIALHSLSLSEISRIENHENDKGTDALYLSGTLTVPFAVYRKK